MEIKSEKLFSLPGMSYADTLKRDVRNVAVEFEAILLKELLKEAFRPLMQGKGYDTKIYYDTFLEVISKKMAEAGGVGIADFILRNLKDGKGR